MKKVKFVVLALVALLGVIAVTPVLTDIVAATPAGEVQKGVTGVGGDTGGGLGPQLRIVINILLFILGSIAVIMIVVGGIRYTTSGGDSSSVKAAKDTVLYAVVGLVVAMLAYAIVNFIVKAF